MTDPSSDAPLPRWACDLLAAVPQAGAGVNIWLYKAARVLHAFRTDAEIRAVLAAAVAGCGRVVTSGEIDRAVERSWQTAYTPGATSRAPRGIQAAFDPVARQAVIDQDRRGLVDLWGASPIECNDGAPCAEEVVDQLFPGDPLLCVANAQPRDAQTRAREEWRGRLATMALIVPSAMTAPTGRTLDDKPSPRCLDNTGPRQYLIVEQDRGTFDEQAAILTHLSAFGPLVVACLSAAKSLHGWFSCRGEAPEAIEEFFRYAITLGADPATWTRCQLVRLPGGTRDNNKPQSLIYYDPSQV